jgi:hypothetical protein
MKKLCLHGYPHDLPPLAGSSSRAKPATLITLTLSKRLASLRPLTNKFAENRARFKNEKDFALRDNRLLS